jgi:CBS domain-containing protein
MRTMKVEKVMVKDVITVERDISVYEAVKLMNKNRIGCLVAVNDDHVVGIITERDMLERVLEDCRDPKETLVSEIMTRQVIVGKPDMRLVEATELLFQKRVKKLPIVEGNRLVGLVTLTDIARVARLDKETLELIETRSRFLEAFVRGFCNNRNVYITV